MEDKFDLDHVIDTYPYPIASIISRLGTWECKTYPERKFNCILDSAEAVSRFLFALVLCCCRDYAECPSAPSVAAFNREFHAALERPSWGHWLRYTRDGLRWLLKSESFQLSLVRQLAKFFFKRPPKFTPSEAAQALDHLLSYRNDIEHKEKQPHNNDQFVKACEDTEPLLRLVIQSLDFLSTYQLEVVQHIDVNKRRQKPPKFNHYFERIQGDQGRFRSKEILNSQFVLENRSVLFRQNESETYLNLDPFLIREPKAGTADDLFFFKEMNSPDSIIYVACKHGGTFNSKKSARAVELEEEMENVLIKLAPLVNPHAD